MKPRILLSASPNNANYITAVKGCGGIPFASYLPEVDTAYDGLILCGGVDIHPVFKGVEHCFIVCNVGEHPQLNLRIVSIDEELSVPCEEELTKSASLLCSYGDILQVWLQRAYSARSRLGLVEGGVNSAVLGYRL